MRRVTVIAHELRGFRPVGGMGTATAFLALALARTDHSVEILLGKRPPESMDPEWREMYRRAGVQIRPVPPSEPVEPWAFAHTHKVALGLRDDPPDVVIAHDFGGPAYAALRLRQAGIAFENTLFIVFCHGPRRYVADLSPNVALGDLDAVLGVSLLEQASIELADVVVSPSGHLVDWMRGRGWELPEQTLVVPYLTESDRTGEAPPVISREGEPLRCIAFFGRIDERKGLKVLAAALNSLEPELLTALELEFVGKTTKTWTRERATGLLSEQTRRALRNVAFASDLDREGALTELSRAGTLAVMPSLQENSPNTVYECLELGIPFIASKVGGVPELIEPEDHARVLFEPTAEGLEAALRRVLADGRVPAAARSAFRRGESLERWVDVLGLRPAPRSSPSPAEEPVDVIRDRRLSGCAAYVVLLGGEDVPDADLVPTLLRAQRATGADVVTCGVRVDGTLHFFPGDAGGLGTVRNGYGTVALYRREVLEQASDLAPHARDPDWPLLAGLVLSGAKIVSLPVALLSRPSPPGSVDNDQAGAVLVAQQFERALPDPLRGAARIAAGLAHQADQPPSTTRFAPVT
jgi:glycosyltransferase involved in cell wall biosynthesis